MTIKQYLDVLVAQAPFVISAVLGLGTLYGKLGLKGNVQLGACFGTGFAVGGVAMVALGGLPADLAGWFSVFIGAVLMGLMPSGIYQAGIKIAEKAAEK